MLKALRALRILWRDPVHASALRPENAKGAEHADLDPKNNEL